MKLLSWDVGIHNCSFIIININNDINKFNNFDDIMNNINIIKWGIVDFTNDDQNIKKNKNLLFENIPKKLDEIPELLDIDTVIIENQPSLKNPQMKSIQMILYTYFLIKSSNVKIEFISASNKLKDIDIDKLTPKKKNIFIVEEIKEENENIENINVKDAKKKLSYSEKKKLSIKYTEYLLNNYNNINNNIELFKKTKKKDDLADSLLQGLYYIKKNFL